MPQSAKRYQGQKVSKRKWDSSMPCRVYHKLYGLKAWKELRLSFLNANPLCVECRMEGKVVVARVVDHIQPHKGNLDLFFDVHNLQSLCKSHHDHKTFMESLATK